MGSFTSIIPEKLWEMPWKYGKYKFQYKLNGIEYSEYKMTFKSKQGNGIVDIKNSGNEMKNPHSVLITPEIEFDILLP